MPSDEFNTTASKLAWRRSGIGMAIAALGFATLSVVLAVWEVHSLNRRLLEQTTLAARSMAVTASELALQKLDTLLGRIAYGAAMMGKQYQLDAPYPSWLNGIHLWTGDTLITLTPPTKTTQGLGSRISNQVSSWIDELQDQRADLQTRVVHIEIDDTVLTLGVLPFRAGAGGRAAIVGNVDVDAIKREIVEPMLHLHGGLELSRIDAGQGIWDQPMSGVLSSWAVKPAETYLRTRRRVITWQTATYLGLTALALTALLVSVSLLVRLVRRETALAQMKANFVADVSHELKTPLATIRLFCETLESGRVAGDDKRLEYYRTIARESTRLSNMINTILDFSRIEGGHEKFELQPLDVGEVVREAYQGYQLGLEQADFEHKLEIEPRLPLVLANQDRISQAVLNLMSNAVKYSDEDRFLLVHVTKDTRRGRRGVLISVHDRGIGIRPDERAHLFEGFFRSNESRVRQRGGTGLGLALVKQIVDAHHGSFHVESRLVKGSTFRIFLPEAEIRPPNDENPTPESETFEQSSNADSSG